jgi:hypothetical protein
LPADVFTGRPVPAEEALAGDDDGVAVRRDGFEEGGRLGGQFLV